MNRDERRQLRRRSMRGTALFALGIVAVGGAIATGSPWLAGLAVVLLVPAVVMLSRAGKSLS